MTCWYVLIDDDGRMMPGEFQAAEYPPCVRVPVLMRGGFGARLYFLTGEMDAQGRRVYRSRLG